MTWHDLMWLDKTNLTLPDLTIPDWHDLILALTELTWPNILTLEFDMIRLDVICLWHSLTLGFDMNWPWNDSILACLILLIPDWKDLTLKSANFNMTCLWHDLIFSWVNFDMTWLWHYLTSTLLELTLTDLNMTWLIAIRIWHDPTSCNLTLT